jgi:hypothetical protein
MIALGEKYKNIKWLPLALPKFKVDNFNAFQEIFEREKIAIIDQEDSTFVQEFNGLHITSNALIDFNIHDLYNNGRMTKQQYSNETGYRQGRDTIGRFTKKLYKHKAFFKIVSDIMMRLPIIRISNILVLETIKDVAPHREQSWVWKFPTEFRIILHDENTEPTIYVTDIESGDTHYIEFPDDTNTVCWSNGTQLYGIDYHGKTSYQLVVNAIIDPVRLEKLLDDSIAKYHGHLNYKLDL